MTISSSLQAGVAGLNANANRLAGIADNIANSSTYGYKRAETDFFSFVVQGSGSSSYTAGGVRTSSVRMIDDQGPLIGSDNSTDLAVDGRGFIAVTDISALPAGSNFPISLMTTGSFRLMAAHWGEFSRKSHLPGKIGRRKCPESPFHPCGGGLQRFRCRVHRQNGFLRSRKNRV